MTIDMAHFTPVSGLIGGILIGLAAVVLMAGPGRIMGLSGIVTGVTGALTDPTPWRDKSWRLAFLTGTLAAPILYMAVSGKTVPVVLTDTPVLLVAGGFLVGLGTRIGGGCTSGHGICGLSRLSPRSFAAVATFMATAMITVALAG